MSGMLAAHIAAGGVGLLTGYVALFSTKGLPLHRRSGMAFVYAMLAMCLFGVIITLANGVAVSINTPAGLLTAYLVLTSLATVRPVSPRWRMLPPGLAVLALTVGVTCLAFGVEAIVTGRGRDGMPPFPFFMFGFVGVIGAIGDARVLRGRALTGAPRLTRHLWRMSFALFIAAMSFFIGQSDEFPAAVRILPLLALPVLAVLVTMFYWLWRVALRRRLKGLVMEAHPSTA